MLDVKIIREKPGIVKESQKKRGLDAKEIDVLLELDEKWRLLKQETENIRSERNKISEKINEAKKHGKDVDDIIRKARILPKKLEEKEKELLELEEKRKFILENLPNIVDKSVPLGDASKNKVIESFGKPKNINLH